MIGWGAVLALGWHPRPTSRVRDAASVRDQAHRGGAAVSWAAFGRIFVSFVRGRGVPDWEQARPTGR